MLPNKYRPNSFEEFLGNEVVIETLQNFLIKEDRPHTYLFYGETGCGKTTLARIMAKEVGTKGMDLREINTADLRGIDTIRDIRSSINFNPLFGSSRSFIIDECHMLTNEAQNALLKIIEDTKDYVYFFFTTTDPSKLIPTLKRRCAKFELKPLNTTTTKNLIKNIVKKEKNEELDIDIIKKIIKLSEGKPGEVLQLLEIALSSSDPLKSIDSEEQITSIDLCRKISNNNNWSVISETLQQLKGSDLEKIRRHVLAYFTTILLNNPNKKAKKVIEEFKEPFFNSGFSGLVLACYNCIER
jgi:DNA polymerase-3 subunit gamma/tau